MAADIKLTISIESVVGKTGAEIAAVATQVLNLAQSIGELIVEWAQLGDQMRDARLASRLNAQELQTLREATSGEVDDLELLRVATNLVAGGLDLTAQQMEKMVLFAKRAGDATGKGFTTVINELTIALASGRTTGLRKYGIALDGVTGKTEIIDAAIEQLGDRVEQFGETSDNAGDAISRMETAMANANQTFAEGFSASEDLTGSLKLLEEGMGGTEISSENAGSAFGTFTALLLNGIFAGQQYALMVQRITGELQLLARIQGAMAGRAAGLAGPGAAATPAAAAGPSAREVMARQAKAKFEAEAAMGPRGGGGGGRGEQRVGGVESAQAEMEAIAALGERGLSENARIQEAALQQKVDHDIAMHEQSIWRRDRERETAADIISIQEELAERQKAADEKRTKDAEDEARERERIQTEENRAAMSWASTAGGAAMAIAGAAGMGRAELLFMEALFQSAMGTVAAFTGNALAAVGHFAAAGVALLTASQIQGRASKARGAGGGAAFAGGGAAGGGGGGATGGGFGGAGDGGGAGRNREGGLTVNVFHEGQLFSTERDTRRAVVSAIHASADAGEELDDRIFRRAA